MSQEPLISVVIPAYNCAPYINKAIDCMLNQTYQNVEILVADDASTDNTREIIDSYDDPRIKKLHNEENLGYLKTCNKLKQAATGNFITFQDADDWSELNRLEVLLDAFRADPELGMVGSNFANIDLEGNEVFHSDLEQDYETIKNVIPEKFPVCGATLMLKKEVYDDIGGYHEYFDRIGAEDFYWMALIVDKYKTINIPDCLYYYLFNPQSVTRQLTDFRKLIIVDIVRFLVNQRRETGTDSLISGDHTELDAFIAKLKAPYDKDPLLYKKKQVQRHFWNDEIKEGYKLAFNVLVRNPFQPRSFYKDLYIYLKPWLRGK